MPVATFWLSQALYQFALQRGRFIMLAVPLLPVIVLLGTVLTAYSHALPFGPLGSACFFIAALRIELVWRKHPDGEKNRVSKVTPSYKDEVLTGNVVSGE